MQRGRLTPLLASLGITACANADATIVAAKPEPLVGAEPSGLGREPKPAEPRSSTPGEPHFDGVPLEFCNAKLQRRDDPLVRTASFLEAWNELAPPIRNRLAQNIPGSEIDARIAVCGFERCSVDAPRVAEVQADYMVGTGVLIPDDGELIVVPAAAEPHVWGPCSNDAAAKVERHGQFIHVRTIAHERHYSYGHGYAGYGYGGHYDPIPIECRTYATHWRDHVIDAERGEVELLIDQVAAEDIAEPPIALEFDLETPQIMLRGCGTIIELRWTR